MEITTEEVYAYRELYYEHVKPMIQAGKTQKEIGEMVEYFAPEYGITSKRYDELSVLDLLQRLGGISKGTSVTIRFGDKDVPTDILETLVNTPELRCPRRSEQLSNPLYETDGN
jgi:hypothetical protein